MGTIARRNELPKRKKIMKIITKKNSPSVKNAMNKGMSFKEFRHVHTNYENAYKALTVKFGFNSAEYSKMVKEFAEEVTAVLVNESHKAEVAAWVAGR